MSLARLVKFDSIEKIPDAHNELANAIEAFGADLAREQVKLEAVKRRLIAFERRARVWQLIYGLILGGAIGSLVLLALGAK